MKSESRKKCLIILSVYSIFLLIGIILFVWRERDENIVISEVCSSNLKEVEYSGGDYPDWVEICNLSDDPVCLDGYSIYTDNEDWERMTFENLTIQGRGYVMIFTPFGISSTGDRIYLSDNEDRVIDRVSIPKMEEDTSYSRQSDGSWIRTEITPEYANSSHETTIPTLDMPVFSHESGFYDEPLDLKLSCKYGEHIYYTIDGSIPDENSLEYSSPIYLDDASKRQNVYSSIEDIAENYSPPDYKVDKANVIRAIVKNNDGEYSEVVTKVYFVWEDEKEEYRNKTIVSLVCDPDDLFSDERGIYVFGDMQDENDPYSTGNFYQTGRESERASDMCVFNKDHIYEFDQKVGIRIKGGETSRGYPQKSFNVYSRKAYEDKYLKKSLFKDIDRMRSFSLYTCSQDTNGKLKDALASKLISDADFETLGYKPAFLFLNGEYWGIYYITERFDRTFFESHTGVGAEDVIKIEDPYLPQQSPEMDSFNILSDFMRNADLSDEGEYEVFCEMADEESMIDYYAVMFYIARLDDWPGGNEAFWKNKSEDETAYFNKWRPLFYDINSTSMDLWAVDNDTISAAIDTGENKIISLMQSRRFREKLCERIRDLSMNDLAPDRVRKATNKLREEMRLPMEGYYRRWCSEDLPYEMKMEAEADNIISFFDQRGKYIIKYAEKYRDDPSALER